MNRASWFGYSEPPHLQNISTIFALQSINLLTIQLALKAFTNVWYFPSSPEILIFVAMSIFTFNYYATGPSGKHVAILEEFKNETREQRLVRGVFYWTYVIGTPTAFAAALFFCI